MLRCPYCDAPVACIEDPHGYGELDDSDGAIGSDELQLSVCCDCQCTSVMIVQGGQLLGLRCLTEDEEEGFSASDLQRLGDIRQTLNRRAPILQLFERPNAVQSA